MTVTLARFTWPLLSAGQPGPSVEVGRVNFDQAGAEVELHLYQMTSADLWDVASWARLVEGTVQPFTVSGEGELSRWWVVDRVSIDGGSVRANGQVRLGLSLGVVRDGGRPIVESLLHGQARRRGILGVPMSNAQAWHAVPTPAAGWYAVVNAAGNISAGVDLTSEFGQVTRFQSTVHADLYQGASPQRPAVAAYPLPPGDAYDGAVRIEVRIGSTWRPIHGLELPAGVEPKDVRISNGLGRVAGSTDVSTEVFHEAYNGSTWTPPHLIDFYSSPGFDRVTVRRNSAAACSIAFSAGYGLVLTVTLRRGAYLPTFTTTQPAASLMRVAVAGRNGSITSHIGSDTAVYGESAPTSAGNTVVLSWVIGAPDTPPSDRIVWESSIPLANSSGFTAGVLPAGESASSHLLWWHGQQTERVLVPR